MTSDSRSVTLREQLYSFDEWKKKKRAALLKEKQFLDKKRAEEEKEKAQQKEKAVKDYLAWKAAKDKEAEVKRAKKAEASKLLQDKAREEEEKKLACKKAFERWLSDKKEEDKEERRKRRPKSAPCSARKGEEGDEGPEEFRKSDFRKQDAQRVFKFWLRKKNEERHARMKAARMRNQTIFERKVKERDELALAAYEKWLVSVGKREELEAEFLEKMRELELSKPPWIPV